MRGLVHCRLFFRLACRQALEEEQLGRERASDSETEVLRKANLLVTKTLFRCVRWKRRCLEGRGGAIESPARCYHN